MPGVVRLQEARATGDPTGERRVDEEVWLVQSEHRYDLYSVWFPAVAREVTQLNEGLVAVWTLIWPLLRVCPQVVLQIWSIHKLFATGSTGVGFLPSVPSLVYFKAAQACKGFPAVRALIRLYPRVCPHVVLKHVQASEGFGTVSALVRLLSSMSSLMEVKSVQSAEGFLTFRAVIWLFSSVDSLMDFKGGELSKGLIALRALERSFTTVYPHVSVVWGWGGEHLSTFRARLQDFSRGRVGALT